MRLVRLSTVSAYSSALMLLGILLSASATAQSASSSSSSMSSSSMSSSSVTTFPRGYSADTSVSVTGPASVNRGTAFTYEFKVQNLGPSVANNTKLMVELPLGLEFQKQGSYHTCYLESRIVICPIADSLTTNKAEMVAVTLKAPYQDACSDITHVVTGRVESTESDSAPGNNMSNAVSTFVRCVAKPSECSDGIDNDKDGLIDYPEDTSCMNATAGSELVNPQVFIDRNAERLRLRQLSRVGGRFFISSSSSSSRSSSRSSSSSSVAPVTSRQVRVSLDADLSEAQPGDAIAYMATVRNPSDAELKNLVLQFDVDPSQVLLTDVADGVQTQPGQVQWYINLAPRETRVIRIGGQVASSSSDMSEGYAINASIRAIGADNTPSAFRSVSVLQHLPQTGISDFFKPLENTGKFLTPIASGSPAAVAFWIVSSFAVATLGLALRKFFRA